MLKEKLWLKMGLRKRKSYMAGIIQKKKKKALFSLSSLKKRQEIKRISKIDILYLLGA